MTRYFLGTFLIIFSLAPFAWAAESMSVKNAGLVPANIWYSKDPFFAGDTVRIYTVVFNGSPLNLSGSMEFLDNGTSIDKKNFTVQSDGHVSEVWVTWTATEGQHTVTARVVEAYQVGADGKKVAVTLENAETGKSERSVDQNPEIKATQAAEEAKKREALKQEVVNKAEQAATAVQNVTAPVRTSAATGVGVLDHFRADTAESLERSVGQKKQDIAVIKAAEEAAAKATTTRSVQSATDRMLNVAEKPFAYVLLALYTVGEYIFKWQVVFYGIILYTLYHVLRWVIRKVRDR